MTQMQTQPIKGISLLAFKRCRNSYLLSGLRFSRIQSF